MPRHILGIFLSGFGLRVDVCALRKKLTGAFQGGLRRSRGHLRDLTQITGLAMAAYAGRDADATSTRPKKQTEDALFARA